MNHETLTAWEESTAYALLARLPVHSHHSFPAKVEVHYATC